MKYLFPFVIALIGLTNLGLLFFYNFSASVLIPCLSVFLLLGIIFASQRKPYEERLKDTLENIGDGFAIYDKDDCLVLCNQPYREMFETIEDVLIPGQAYEKILRIGIERGLYPPKGHDVDEWLASRLEIKKAQKSKREELLKDGRWLLVRESRTLDGYRVSIRTDITEIKQREERLQQLYRAVNQSASMVIITDYQGSIEYVNKRFIEQTGYAEDEILGRSPNLFTGGDTKEIEYRTVWQTISQGGIWRGELNRQRKNGELFWVLATVSPIKDAEGTVTHYVAIEDDITQRKVTENALLEAKENAVLANKSKSDFLTNMSHELRTPLNHIIGFSEMLRAQPIEKLKQEKFDQYMDCIYDSGNHLLESVNTIMETAHIEAGTVVLHKKDFNPADLIAACSSSLDGRMRAANVSLLGNVAENIPIIHGDDVRLQQVLFNLLSNAIKFSKPGDTITLGAKPIENNMFEFCVSDTGCGIARDKQKDIFKLFEQSDSSLTRHHEGLGLGLALAKRLVDLHEGQISFDSVEGERTTFFVRIPR